VCIIKLRSPSEWFTNDDDNKMIYVVTRTETGKVKRLRNNSKVRVMPHGLRGQPKGEWINGKATFATAEQLEIALKQRNKKYGLKARLSGHIDKPFYIIVNKCGLENHKGSGIDIIIASCNRILFVKSF
jgi:hypothetical protein